MSIEATRNLVRLSQNVYPGRGIVIGTSGNGSHIVQIYWIMGRSENSRNRVFLTDSGRVFTAPADWAKMKDPSLIIYNAMNEIDECYVVSNGDQTDTVMSYLYTNRIARLGFALSKRAFEPDAPNFTPRITGLCIREAKGKYRAELSLLRRSELCADECERSYYEYSGIMPGFGFCVTTYDSDGDPLPAFAGSPFPVPLIGSIEEIAHNFWGILNQFNRVAIAVKFICMYRQQATQVVVINRFTQVKSEHPLTTLA